MGNALNFFHGFLNCKTVANDLSTVKFVGKDVSQALDFFMLPLGFENFFYDYLQQIEVLNRFFYKFFSADLHSFDSHSNGSFSAYHNHCNMW